MMKHIYQFLLIMSLNLEKSLFQDSTNLSLQHRKLNELIEKIEQQKVVLATWENVQADIQQRARQTLLPAYADLHQVMFQQMQQLWNMLSSNEFSKADLLQLDNKIQNLATQLTNIKTLTTPQKSLVERIIGFYQQHADHISAKKIKNNQKNERTNSNDQTQKTDEDAIDDFDFEAFENDAQQQFREQAKQKKQQEKREHASMMANQSLRTVYLKIAAMIHPDREQDEQKKQEKTVIFQHANQAYEQKDLFNLLKIQIQIEQHKSMTPKVLSSEQVKFYKIALDTQVTQLNEKIDEIIASFHWVNRAEQGKRNTSQKIKLDDVYKALDVECAEIKQHIKWEKERLKYMTKLKNLEILLGNRVL